MSSSAVPAGQNSRSTEANPGDCQTINVAPTGPNQATGKKTKNSSPGSTSATKRPRTGARTVPATSPPESDKGGAEAITMESTDPGVTGPTDRIVRVENGGASNNNRHQDGNPSDSQDRGRPLPTAQEEHLASIKDVLALFESDNRRRSMTAEERQAQIRHLLLLTFQIRQFFGADDLVTKVFFVLVNSIQRISQSDAQAHNNLLGARENGPSTRNEHSLLLANYSSSQKMVEQLQTEVTRLSQLIEPLTKSLCQLTKNLPNAQPAAVYNIQIGPCAQDQQQQGGGTGPGTVGQVPTNPPYLYPPPQGPARPNPPSRMNPDFQPRLQHPAHPQGPPHQPGPGSGRSAWPEGRELNNPPFLPGFSGPAPGPYSGAPGQN